MDQFDSFCLFNSDRFMWFDEDWPDKLPYQLSPVLTNFKSFVSDTPLIDLCHEVDYLFIMV